MKVTIKNGAMSADGSIVACPIDTEATVTAEVGRQLVDQGIAVEVAAPKHEHKAEPKPHAPKPAEAPADK